jgi:penicillin-binding protein 2
VIQPSDDRRPPITPQLALRVAIIGGVAFAMFAIIFFRLWFLQVLSGDQYLAQAQTNRTRDISVQAPRGEILDRSGKVLVETRQAVAVVIEPPKLPKDGRARNALYRRLSEVIGLSTRPAPCHVGAKRMVVIDVACRVLKQQFLIPYADVTVKTDVPADVTAYLAERQSQFPGVVTQDVFLRHYPFDTVAAQLFGTVGQITSPELHQQHYRGVPQGTVVGQSGIEYTYDRYLRGRDGATRVQVDAFGRARGYLPETRPVPGKTLQLSIDVGLEKAGYEALQRGISAAQSNGNPAAAGAFVALDPRDGSVLGMGSWPTFNPNIFAKPVPESKYQALNNPASNFPLINRAMMSGYPTGSTFKVITATAALQSGTITPGTVIDDPGSIVISGQKFSDAGGHGAGAVSLPTALQVSSDVFFYQLGAWLNSAKPQGGPLQQWAGQYGIGRRTGIDLGGEIAGNLPSPAWRSHRNDLERACEKRHHDTVPCGYSDLRQWSIGDNVQLATGQGDLLASPLQMAVVYSAIENGGTIVHPHVGQEVLASNGTVLQKIDPGPVRRIPVSASTLDPIRAGLHAAASQPGGTSADVFAGFPYPVYGKTGTAQRYNQADQSWYVCYVPDARRPIVVAVTIEQGGFGAQAAAPAARLILSHWFGVHSKFVAGTSTTR